MSQDVPARWVAPDFAPPPPPPPPPPPAPEPVEEPVPVKVGPSVEELAEIERAAREEGFAQGHAEGLAQGQAEVQRLIAQLQAVVDGFTQPLAAMDDEVAEALGVAAVRIAGALLGRAYAADPTLLAELVRTTLAELAGEEREAVVHLNPQDLALIESHLEGCRARLQADPALARGDVRVHTPTVRIDGTLQTRLDVALAELHHAEAAE